MNRKSETFSHLADTPMEDCKMAGSFALFADLVKSYNLSTEPSTTSDHNTKMSRDLPYYIAFLIIVILAVIWYFRALSRIGQGEPKDPRLNRPKRITIHFD